MQPTPNEEATAPASTIYIGYCPVHNWEGFRRDNRADAEQDLEGHIGLFPDESHSGARILEE